MVAITQLSQALIDPHLRPFDMRKDMLAVADLVELCFADTLDQDGRRYLNQMRSAAHQAQLPGWARLAVNRITTPMEGYVWEEDGRLVGNLSLISFLRGGRRIYLIANVAVHPEYRRRGIARHLTAAAIQKTCNRADIWLQVRVDNPGAVALYTNTGFHERACRTTWVVDSGNLQTSPVPGIRVGRRKSHHWPAQQEWLRLSYPLQLRWYFPLRSALLQPGLLGILNRLVTDLEIRQWTAQRGQQLLGMLTWQASYGQTERLWLAAAPQQVDLTLQALLAHLRAERSLRRSLSIDYPAGQAVETLTAAGFQPQHTLIWMEYAP